MEKTGNRAPDLIVENLSKATTVAPIALLLTMMALPLFVWEFVFVFDACREVIAKVVTNFHPRTRIKGSRAEIQKSIE